MNNIKDILIEHPIDIPELNVKGFIDIVVIMESGEVYVYDIKTVGSWSWRYKFGRKKESNPSIHQELQLATYGIALEREYGKVDGMFIIYYNKNTSIMKQIEVSNDRISDAISFWKGTIDNHKDGLPIMEKGVTPVMKWECNYCEYLSKCNEDNNEKE